MYKKFKSKKVADGMVEWIQNWFKENGNGCSAVIGISGGKDSTIVAAACVKALGKENVIGVIMPNGKMEDKEIAYEVCDLLGIRYVSVNIAPAFSYLVDSVSDAVNSIDSKPTEQMLTNLPSRLRMCTLYAVAQSVNGRVANTCNLSEDWIGYSTLFGDGAGSFSPLGELTVTEVKAVGYEFGLPAKFIEKVPSDGLCGKTDEENFGFTYDVLDEYISTGVCKDAAVKAKIDDLHDKNMFKIEPMATYIPFDWEDAFHE